MDLGFKYVVGWFHSHASLSIFYRLIIACASAMPVLSTIIPFMLPIWRLSHDLKSLVLSIHFWIRPLQNWVLSAWFLVHQYKLEDPVATICVLVCPSKDQKVRSMTAEVVQRQHGVVCPRWWHLTEHGQRTPLLKVDIEDADVVESHASSLLVDIIVTTPVQNQQLMIALS